MPAIVGCGRSGIAAAYELLVARSKSIVEGVLVLPCGHFYLSDGDCVGRRGAGVIVRDNRAS